MQLWLVGAGDLSPFFFFAIGQDDETVLTGTGAVRNTRVQYSTYLRYHGWSTLLRKRLASASNRGVSYKEGQRSKKQESSYPRLVPDADVDVGEGLLEGSLEDSVPYG